MTGAAAPRAAEALPLLAEALDEAFARLDLDRDVPAALWEAALVGPLAEYSRRPAKELRTALCQLGWSLAGGAGTVPAAVPLVIDALHTGSLVIDDIEDDAAERRGAPALHVLHGEGTAINAGNWLYFFALERLAGLGGDAATQLALHRRAIATLLACHHGQALDLRARADAVDVAHLGPVCAAITRGKTAGLVGLAMELAARTAGAGEADATAIAGLGATVGTALQQLDDLGGLGRARRGKGHEDLRARRVTWAWAWLPETCDPLGVARFQARVRHAATAPVAELDALADALRAQVEALGRRRIRATLDDGLAGARAVHGDHPALRGLAALVDRLEESYG